MNDLCKMMVPHPIAHVDGQRRRRNTTSELGGQFAIFSLADLDQLSLILNMAAPTPTGVRNLPTFALERYFAKYEFTAPYIAVRRSITLLFDGQQCH